jgi:hypothetical protein
MWRARVGEEDVWTYQQKGESRDEWLARRAKRRIQLREIPTRVWARSPPCPPQLKRKPPKGSKKAKPPAAPPAAATVKAEPVPATGAAGPPEVKAERKSSEDSSDSGDKKTGKKGKKRKKVQKGKAKKRKRSRSSSFSSSSSSRSSSSSSSGSGSSSSSSSSSVSTSSFDERMGVVRAKPPVEVPDVGPKPLAEQIRKGDISYGGAMMPGEGQAYAKYVQENKRIPRRGEVGLTSDQIEHFEDLGYIMSGSRHRRMNAIRIRKENQVYTAEEKRALAILNHEEKAKRENQIVSDFRALIDAKTSKKATIG